VTNGLGGHRGGYVGLALLERGNAWIDGVNLHVLPAGPIQTNAYLLTSPERGEAVLIDAPGDVWADVKPILAAEKCHLSELWITHGHWGSHAGRGRGRAGRRRQGAGARRRQVMIENPELMERFMGGRIKLEAVKVDHWSRRAERFAALGTEVEARHVPGHCPGNVLFYFPAAGMAFVGDALFNGSVGRTDLPGGILRP